MKKKAKRKPARRRPPAPDENQIAKAMIDAIAARTERSVQGFKKPRSAKSGKSVP